MVDLAAIADLLVDIRDALAEPLPDLVSEACEGWVGVRAVVGSRAAPTRVSFPPSPG